METPKNVVLVVKPVADPELDLRGGEGVDNISNK